MKAWYEVNHAEGGGWYIAAANPAHVVPMVHLDTYEDAMTLARMVASTLRLDIKTRIEETP